MMAIKTKERLPGLISENGKVMVAAIFVGTMAGIATFLLKESISFLSGMITHNLSISKLNYQFLIYPAIGILFATIFQLFMNEDLSNGSEQLKSKVTSSNYQMRSNMILSPLLGCLMTVGLGGSAGAEGPSAFSGAAIGSTTARWFKLSPSTTRILFGCGAAAGIAGIFKSPVGGIMFAIEILRMEFSVMGLLAVIGASVTSFAVCFTLSGFSWNIILTGHQLFEPTQLLWIALLGIFCGIYSFYYNYTQTVSGKFLKRIQNRWIRAGISGLGLGVLILLFPPLFGEGYNTVSDVINSNAPLILFYSPLYSYSANTVILLFGIAGILLIKGFAVGATNNGGGIAGKFAPTIFAGCLCGYLFAMTVNFFFDANLSPQNFALIGTAAVMAGALKAPLMAIFIAAEISDRYNFIIAFIVVAVFSYIIKRSIELLISRVQNVKQSIK